MHLINLNMLYDVIQVLNIKRKHSTKNEHFSQHALFSTIYSLQKKKLNHSN
jgi:hypothetical protein